MNRRLPISPTATHAGVHVFPVVSVGLANLLFLVLLVGTPLSSHHKPLLLPEVPSPPLYLDAGDLVVISVQQDGSVFVGPKWYPVKELPTALQAVVRREPSATRIGLVLCIDRTVPFSSVRHLLRLVSATGASHVILRVERAA